ncbi:DUF943 family protein [Rosenbergiella australiborealis]|uniref:DUF943 family protein n=1 Tax=Rosenbergiella australiborealis TaxID=1544696 RepID=UPI001F4D90DD
MKSIYKKYFLLLLIIICILFYYIFIVNHRPVEIVAVHQDENYSFVLVKNFPISKSNKIAWWIENKDSLARQYGIPLPAPYGGFSIVFFSISKGYKEKGKYDRLCFIDMKPPKNCIDKEKIFSVTYSKNRGTIFTVSSGEYKIESNNKIKKVN